MTVPPSRKHRARHLVASRITAFLAVVTLAAGLSAPLAASASAPPRATTTTPAPDPTPTPTGTPDPGSTSFTVAPIRNGLFSPGESLTASVTLQNATALIAGPIEVTLAIGDQTLDDRAALTAWLGGDGSGATTTAIGSATVDAVAPGEVRSAAVTVAAETPALAALTPGVHPLVASYGEGAERRTSTSVVVVPTGAALDVGVVVPITVGPQSDALLTADELTVLTDVAGPLTDQLDGVAGTNAILAVDPAVPAAIRVLGVSAPATAVAWLERLEALPNTRFALQYGDADPAVQIEAGLARPLAPTSLSTSMRAADFPANPTPTATPTSTPSATPTPTPTPTAGPTYPTLDELLSIGNTRDEVYWPADGTTPAATTALGAISNDDERALTLLSSTATVEGAAGGTVGARARAGDAELLVADADVSRELSDAASLDESSLRAAPLAAASGYLAFAAEEAGGATILAALDRRTDRSNVGVRTAVTTVSEFPGATSHSLTSIVGDTAATVQLTDAASPAERVDDAIALLADEAELTRFATILDDPTLLTAVERAEILQLLGVAWAGLPDESRAAIATHREATATTLESVRLLPTSTINLFAAGAGLPFTVRNDLPYPVNLVLYASPDDLRLNVQRANDIVATPLSNTRVEVPVEARVGNGEVTIDLQLRSPSFVAVGPPASVPVNVRAEWETVGVIALSIIVGGLVLLGIIRTVLRVRARRKTPDAESAADAGAAAEGDDG